MGMADQFNVQNIYAEPALVDSAVTKYNQRNPARKLSGDDVAALKSNPALAKAVFSDGLQDLIAARATTVAELKDKPQELLGFLGYNNTRQLLTSNVVTVDDLAKISLETLEKAGKALSNSDAGHLMEGTMMLGLNEEQKTAFFNAVQQKQVQQSVQEFFFSPAPPTTPRPPAAKPLQVWKI